MDPPWKSLLIALALALLATSLLAAPQMNDFLGQDDQDTGTDDMERAAMDNLNVGQMPSGQGWGKGQGVPNTPQYTIVNGKKVQVPGVKRQGGGKGGQSGGRNKGGKGKGDKGKEAEDFTEQSKQAMLQLGVLVGVSLLVAGLFLLNALLEQAFEKFQDKMAEVFKHEKPRDVEEQDAAALVGTFKRYK